MKCQDCGFISFDGLDKCKRCGAILKSLSVPVGKVLSEKKDFYAAKTGDGESLSRPLDIDKIIKSIKNDIEEIDKLPGKDSSDMIATVQGISSDMQQYSGMTHLSSDIDQNKNAGFLIRLLSYTIDNVILFMISAVLLITAYFLIGYSFVEKDNPADMIKSFYALFLIASTIIDLFYFTYFHAVKGQTVGKWVCGIKVVAEDGSLLGFKKAFIRFLGYIISRLLLYTGFLWIGFDRKKQGFHDKIAKSFVVRV